MHGTRLNEPRKTTGWPTTQPNLNLQARNLCDPPFGPPFWPASFSLANADVIGFEFGSFRFHSLVN